MQKNADKGMLFNSNVSAMGSNFIQAVH